MAHRVLITAIVLLVQVAAPPLAAAAGEATLVGAPQVTPAPLVPGKAAEVAITLRAGEKPSPPVQLEARILGKTVGKTADAPIPAKQTKTYKIAFLVPATAEKLLEVQILGWGAELASTKASVQVAAKTEPAKPEPAKLEPARPPAKESAPAKAPAAAPPTGSRSAGTPPPPPSLTQTVNTARATMTGNRGQQGPPPAPPSLTQTVTTSAASMTGNRGQQQIPPPPPSMTQTVTTQTATMTGDR